MLRFKEFLNSAAPMQMQPPGQANGETPKPPPELVNLANKAKQSLNQAKSSIGTPGSADKMKQVQQMGQELTNKGQQFQMQQYDAMADKILRASQPITGR